MASLDKKGIFVITVVDMEKLIKRKNTLVMHNNSLTYIMYTLSRVFSTQELGYSHCKDVWLLGHLKRCQKFSCMKCGQSVGNVENNKKVVALFTQLKHGNNTMMGSWQARKKPGKDRILQYLCG